MTEDELKEYEEDKLLLRLLEEIFGECDPTFIDENGNECDNFEPGCLQCCSGKLIRSLREAISDYEAGLVEYSSNR